MFVHRLGNALVERGHDVSMLTFAAKAPADANYRLHRLGRGSIARSRWRLAVAPMTLTARSPSNVDVLHLHGDDWFYVGRRVPTVRTFYGSALCEARSATSTGRRILQSMIFPLELLASRLATSSFAIADGMPAGYRLMGELPLGFTPPQGCFASKERSAVSSLRWHLGGPQARRLASREVCSGGPPSRSSSPTVDGFGPL